MKSNKNVSQMQIEVWKMKDKVYEKTRKMNSREFFGYIKNESKEYPLHKKMAAA